MKAEKIKILFVCYANTNRSTTAEEICREIAEQNKLEIEASSAGLSLFSLLSGRKLTRKIADKADKIFVMEDYMKEILLKNYLQSPEKIITLNIKDIYSKNDPELESILRRDLTFHFHNTINLSLNYSF